MKTNRMLKAAAWLWGLAVLSVALWPGGTQAKYVAGAEASVSARVAKWDIKITYEDISAALDSIKDKVVSQTFTAVGTLVVSNDSEVAARVKPVALDGGTAVDWITFAPTGGKSTDSDGFVIMGYGGDTITYVWTITAPLPSLDAHVNWSLSQYQFNVTELFLIAEQVD